MAESARTDDFKTVTHVIFDVDGLILDTETLYTNLMHTICEPYKKKFTWDLKKKLMGRKQREAAKIFIEELDLPLTIDEYCQTVNDLMKKTFPDAKLLPGVDKLIRHLHKHNIPLAVATGSHTEEMELKTRQHKDLFGLFSHSVYSSEDPDVQHGKPAPDCFLVAARRFGGKEEEGRSAPDPDKVLVFEDAPNGVDGALAAGMQVVWVPDSHLDKNTHLERATLTLDSLEEFKPERFGLPAYDDETAD